MDTPRLDRSAVVGWVLALAGGCGDAPSVVADSTAAETTSLYDPTVVATAGGTGSGGPVHDESSSGSDTGRAPESTGLEDDATTETTTGFAEGTSEDGSDTSTQGTMSSSSLGGTSGDSDSSGAETHSGGSETDGSETATDDGASDSSATGISTRSETDGGSSEETTEGSETCGDGVTGGGEACDEGVANGDGSSGCTSSCALNVCGDGYVHVPTEACDLGTGNGPPPATCTSICNDQQLAVAAGGSHTCARLVTGAVRCWGYGAYGRLGYGNVASIGDDETPASAGDVDVGGIVLQVATGDEHTCALLDTGAVRCWGRGGSGRLGYANTNHIGDGETPASAGDVDVGGTVVEITAGVEHTCARLDTGEVRCWGSGDSGRLGYGDTNDIGDDEAPASAGSVDIGGTVVEIAAGNLHTCARLDTGAVRCWGRAISGALGYGNVSDVGDDETPASAGDIDLGGAAAEIVTGGAHTCARLVGGEVKCWGYNDHGQLGYDTQAIYHAPLGSGVDVGGTAVQLAAGLAHTCARLDTNAVRCWGRGDYGQLGYSDTVDVGDGWGPSVALVGDVDVGGSVLDLDAGRLHTCARLDDGALRCWGSGGAGRLGYGSTNNVGDDETPASAGDVPVL